MRMVLRFTTFVLIVILGMYTVWPPTSMIEASETSWTVPTDTGFEVGESWIVDVSIEGESVNARSHLEREEQVLDWLLTTVASRSELPNDALRQALVGLPPARNEFLSAATSLQYGPVRSLYLGAGKVIALVPAAITLDEQKQWLGEVADEHTKNLGERPSEIDVFRYQLDLERDCAYLERSETIAVEHLYTTAAGYRSFDVTDAEGLAAALQEFDDLVGVRVGGPGLTITGRVSSRADKKRVTIEHVATLWCGQKDLDGVRQESLGFSLDWSVHYEKLADRFERFEPALREAVDSGLSSITDEKIDLVKEGLAAEDELPFLRLVHELQIERDRKSVV